MTEMITIPKAQYDRLVEIADDISDSAAFDRAVAALATGDDELIPSEFAKRLMAGESPLKVYRELRKMTQVELSDASGVNRVQIAQIEGPGPKTGSAATLKRLAAVLDVSLDDLV